MIGRTVNQSGLEKIIEDLIALGGWETKGGDAVGRERGHTEGRRKDRLRKNASESAYYASRISYFSPCYYENIFREVTPGLPTVLSRCPRFFLLVL